MFSPNLLFDFLLYLGYIFAMQKFIILSDQIYQSVLYEC